MSTKSGQRAWLRTIVGLTLVTRLSVTAMVMLRRPSGWIFRSQGELGWLAQSILAGHGMSSPFGGDTGPTAFLAPGYPALVAAVFKMFGVFTPASALAILILHTLFGLATAILLVRMAEREFGATTANLAGLFWALGPPFVFLPLTFWDSSFTLFALTAALNVALQCAHKPGLRLWLLMGMLGGVTLLVNPSLALVFAGIFTWVLAAIRPRDYAHALVAALLCLAIFAPWPIRNQRVMHSFIPFRSNFGFELWKGNHSGSFAIDNSSYYPVFNRAEYDAYKAKGEVEFVREKSLAAHSWIKANPAAFARLSAKRFLRYWSGTGAQDVSPIIAAQEILTTALSIIGLILLVRARRIRLVILFAIPLLLFPLPYYVTHAEMRFRLLLEPVTLVLAAYAVTRIVGILRSLSRATNICQVAPICRVART